MTFTFIAALIVPWLAGATLLAAARHVRWHEPHPGRMLRLAGYGFFIGQALLYALIRFVAAITGALSVSAVLWILIALALAAFAATRLVGRPPGATPPHPAPASTTPTERVLTWLLLAWALLHFSFAIIDVLSIPVFSWDAWLVWMYRAKAWFFSAALPEMAAPGRWFAAESVPPYTIDAFDYPDFLSVTTAWLALSLGRWSGTLLNLPGLLGALAIGLALAGHLKRLGLPAAMSAALVYLLFSTPLFGTHTALGGYADLWMAGFAGLGMIALMAGLPRYEKGYILLGLALLLFSALVKNEGSVWLVLGLAMVVAFTVPTRLKWIGAGLGAALVVLAALTGYTYIEIPGVGLAGLQDSRLHLPFIGRFVLETHQVLPEYIDSLFVLGSWNLLWYLLPGAALLALTGANARERSVMLSFLALFAASQAFIFGFTNQGEWAKQYTAINRLPLQFLPALLFALGVAIASQGPLARPPGTAKKAAMAALSAMALTVLLVAGWLHGESDGEHEALNPDLNFVMGAGVDEPAEIEVQSYQQGFALLSTGPTRVDAASYPFVRIGLQNARFNDPALAPAVFWRRADSPGQPSRMTLAGDGMVRLDGQAEWSGQITEFGLLVPDAGPGPVRIHEFTLEPASMGNLWHMAWRGWLAFEPWSLRSVNFLWGGAAQQSLHLPPVVAACTLLALLVAWWRGRRLGGRTWLAPAAIIVLAAWVVLDVRWTANGIRQAQHSVRNGLFLSPDERLSRMPDGEVRALVQRFRENASGAQPGRVLVVGDRAEFGYYLERAKYHLLPHSAQVVPRLADRFRQVRVDHVLFVGDFSNDGAWQNTWNRLPMDDGWRDALELADANTQAILFRVER